MYGKRKITVVFLLIFLLTLSLMPHGHAKNRELFTVWVPTNLHKIMRDQEIPLDEPLELNLAAARNEYESGQVIIRAGDSGLRKLHVSVSDLKQNNGKAKIKKEHIQLFRQHYIEVTTPTTKNYPTGWYPDALIPLSGKITVEPNQNQGIWLKIYVPKDQPAGEYKGYLTIHETGKPVRIPINFTVWDFELPDESHVKTAFGIWGGPIQRAHGNVEGEEAWSYIEKYYWASVEHRLVPGYLPIPDTNIDEYVRRAEKFIKDPRVSAYRLPYYRTSEGEPDIYKIKELVDKLREKNLLDKAYFYITELDEPSFEQFDRVKHINDALKIAAPDVPHLVTIQPIDELLGNVDIWVPSIDKFDYEFTRERQENGEQVWWYTYVKPTHPFPSYHIDDDLVGTRLLTWMQHDYGVEGTLYWATTQFEKYDYNQQKYVERDVWKDPIAFPGANGDGFLFYPGTEIGIDGPVGTIRLETLRESMEDYEYLWLYEQKLRQIASKWGIEDNFSYRDALRPFYDKLYDDIKAFNENEPEKIFEVRKEIANEIVTLTNDSPLITVTKPMDGVRKIQVYVDKDIQVFINGKALELVESHKDYNVFSLEKELTTGTHQFIITVIKNGEKKEIKREITVYETNAPYYSELNDVETTTDIERFISTNVNITLSNEFASSGQYSMKVTYLANVNFPNVRLFNEGNGFQSADWTAFETLRFDVYNPEETAQFYVKFHGTDGQSDDSFLILVRAGAKKTIEIPLRQVNIDLTKVRGIEIWMWRQNKPVTLYFDNFHFTSKEPQEPMIPK